MRIKTCKSIFGALLSVLLLCSMSLTAFAVGGNVDFERIGSIALTLRSSDDAHEIIPGGRFTLYPIADVSIENAGLTYSLREEFAGSGVSLEDPSNPALAEHLAAYAQSNQIIGTEKEADENGTVTFDSLSVGLYLIVQSGSVPGWYPINPFLLSIPMTDAEGSGWIYDVEASPKAEPRPESPDDTKLTVKKVWFGAEGGHPDSVKVQLLRDGEVYDNITLSEENDWKHTWDTLDNHYRWSIVEVDVPDGYTVSYSESGATITIENSKESDIPKNPDTLTVKKVWKDNNADKRPNEVTVELWSGNTLYDTVILNDSNGWNYTWKELPERSDWRIREVNVPDNYEVSYSTDGAVITVKNTAKTETPEKPPLIHTGQLNWPIPVLAGAGVLLLLVGWFLVNKKRKTDEK